MNTSEMREVADRLVSLEMVGKVLRATADEIDLYKERLAMAEMLVALCIDDEADLAEIRDRAGEYFARYLLAIS